MITKEQAIKLFDSEFWKEMSFEQRAKFQISEKRLCMPFNVFHEAVEKHIGRPVFTHEFGLNYDGIKREIYYENLTPPTFEEIINLIPEDKRLILIDV